MRFIRPSKNKNSGLDSTFRDGLKDIYVTPDPQMWDKISDNIDADIKRRRYNHWYLAALLLLLPITLTNVFISYDLEEYYNEFTQEKLLPSSSQSNEFIVSNDFLQLPQNTFWEAFQNSYDTPLSTQEEVSDKTNLDEISNVSSFTELIDARENEITANSFGLSNENNSKENESPILLASVGPDIIITSDFIPEIQSEAASPLLSNSLTDRDRFKKNSKTGRKQELNSLQAGIYIGVFSGVQHNKLFRRENQFAPILGDNVKLSSSSAFSYGARIGWNFNRFIALETGIAQSKMDVSFLDNRYNKIFTKGNITAKYIEVPVNLKFKYTSFNGINNLPHSIVFSTGVTYAQLTSASLVFGDVRMENAKEYFDPMQLALNLGLEYDWFVHKNISINLGASASMFSSPNDFPKFSVKNASSDLRLNYRFNLGVNFLLPTSK